MSIFHSMVFMVCITAIVPSGLDSFSLCLSRTTLQQDAFHFTSMLLIEF